MAIRYVLIYFFIYGTSILLILLTVVSEFLQSAVCPVFIVRFTVIGDNKCVLYSNLVQIKRRSFYFVDILMDLSQPGASGSLNRISILSESLD